MKLVRIGNRMLTPDDFRREIKQTAKELGKVQGWTKKQTKALIRGVQKDWGLR